MIDSHCIISTHKSGVPYSGTIGHCQMSGAVTACSKTPDEKKKKHMGWLAGGSHCPFTRTATLMMHVTETTLVHATPRRGSLQDGSQRLGRQPNISSQNGQGTKAASCSYRRVNDASKNPPALVGIIPSRGGRAPPIHLVQWSAASRCSYQTQSVSPDPGGAGQLGTWCQKEKVDDRRWGKLYPLLPLGGCGNSVPTAPRHHTLSLSPMFTTVHLFLFLYSFSSALLLLGNSAPSSCVSTEYEHAHLGRVASSFPMHCQPIRAPLSSRSSQ